MTTIRISLPDSLKSFLDGQVAEGRHKTADAYIRTLIQEEQKRKAKERLEEMLLEGLQSESSELTKADWEEIRREVKEKLTGSKKRPASAKT